MTVQEIHMQCQFALAQKSKKSKNLSANPDKYMYINPGPAESKYNTLPLQTV